MGTIKLFAGNFVPHGYAFCHGQLLPINQNQALFSILGTTYGGDGKTTFALPDLRGRVPVGAGTGKTYAKEINPRLSGWGHAREGLFKPNQHGKIVNILNGDFWEEANKDVLKVCFEIMNNR